MDFSQAAERFRQIEAQRAAGQLSDAGYRAELNQLRVYDEQGRLWMPQEGTGRWHVYVNGAWKPATPPRTARTPQGFQAQAPQKVNTGCAVGKAIQILIVWVVVFAIIAVVAYVLSDQQIEVVGGVALAAGISALIMFFRMIQAYEGRITNIRTEERTTYDDDGYATTNRTTYAYLQCPNGKTKRVHAHRGWQVGDYVVKRRGFLNPKKVE